MYRQCESYREADGKVKLWTALGLGHQLLTSTFNERIGEMCDEPRLFETALEFYGKWFDEKTEAQKHAE